RRLTPAGAFLRLHASHGPWAHALSGGLPTADLGGGCAILAAQLLAGLRAGGRPAAPQSARADAASVDGLAGTAGPTAGAAEPAPALRALRPRHECDPDR